MLGTEGILQWLGTNGFWIKGTYTQKAYIQVDAYNSCKTDLKQDEAILNVDYSESYKNKQQDEIQSADFGQSTFSLFTASVYHTLMKVDL